MKSELSLVKTLQKQFDQKQNELVRYAGEMGDGSGNLYPNNLNGFVNILIGTNVLPVFNNRVPEEYGLKVWVGYAPEEPTLFQVLSTRSEKPSESSNSGLGYAPASRYEWLAPNGGQDPLNVHLRAITPLKLGTSAAGGMNVDLFRGFIFNGKKYIAVPRQNIDLSSYIPITENMAAFVMISLDGTGTVIKTKGAEVDIKSLEISAQPDVPANAVFVSGLVRVYYGQTAVREGRANTDFVDLRFYASQGIKKQYRALMWEEDPLGGWHFMTDDDVPNAPMYDLVNLE